MDEATLKRLRQITHDMSILYVEDDEAIRSQMVKYLGKFFGNIVTAEDGQKGLEWYELRPFDIVMTDILMPTIDGLEMIAQMRERHPEQVIMVTSSYSDSENLMRCIDLNVDRFVPKPIDFSRLITLLLQTAVTIHNKRRSETLERTAQRDSKEHAEILDKINHGVLIFKGGSVDHLNATMSEILNFTDLQEVRELSIASMIVEPEIGDRDNRGIIDFFKEHPDAKIAIRPIDAEHESRYYIVRYERLESSGKEMLTFFDINAMETELKSLNYVINVDETTGLGSRRALMKTLERLREAGEGNHAITCVAICNLDAFKQKFGFRSFGRVFKLLGGYFRQNAYRTEEGEELSYYSTGSNQFVILHDADKQERIGQIIDRANEQRFMCETGGKPDSMLIKVRSTTLALTPEQTPRQVAVELEKRFTVHLDCDSDAGLKERKP